VRLQIPSVQFTDPHLGEVDPRVVKVDDAGP
jgi:hypothetical protein